MSYFGDFLDEERLLILSIPVRAGYWISQIDDMQGTKRDDEKERLGLEKALKQIFSKTHDDAFTNDVMEETLKNRKLWPAWENNASTVLADIPKAMGLIRDRLPADACKGYQKAVYYIANVVAQAAAEKGGEDDLTKEVMGSAIVSGLLDRLSVKTDMKTPDNVSETEKAALQKLLQCLKG
jgi:hypothetical protein